MAIASISVSAGVFSVLLLSPFALLFALFSGSGSSSICSYRKRAQIPKVGNKTKDSFHSHSHFWAVM